MKHIGTAVVLLTARAECFLVDVADPFAESVRRLEAYANAGADVLFAPGVRMRDDIRAVVDAVRPKPVNVLMSTNTGLRVADLADLGVRRMSVGSASARTAWSAFSARGAADRRRRNVRSARSGHTVRRAQRALRQRAARADPR